MMECGETSVDPHFFKKKDMQKKITIELKHGRWLVNKKRIEDCSDWEKEFMNRFFQEVRTENLIGL